MANKKFQLARYLISSDENKIKFCFICNKDVLSRDFKNHLLCQKHKDRLVLQQNQGESELDFISEYEPEMKFCPFCKIPFSPMDYEVHMYNGKHDILNI